MQRRADTSTSHRSIQLIAEGVLHLDQKLDRTAEEIRNEMRHGFSETQAMIKFS